jgi:hypothetical protein
VLDFTDLRPDRSISRRYCIGHQDRLNGVVGIMWRQFRSRANDRNARAVIAFDPPSLLQDEAAIDKVNCGWGRAYDGCQLQATTLIAMLVLPSAEGPQKRIHGSFAVRKLPGPKTKQH